jgi:hypothetical protein
MVQTLQPRFEELSSPRPLSWNLVTLLDTAAIVVAAALAVMVAADAGGDIRALAALVFVVGVPGWTVLRMAGAPVNLLSGIVSVALSVSAIIVIGESIALLGGWHWFPIAVVLPTACAAVGVRTMLGRRAGGIAGANGTPRPATVALPTWVGWCCALTACAGIVFVDAGLGRSDLAKIGMLGVVDALSPLYWFGAALIVGGLVAGCAYGSRWAWVNVGGLIVALFGLPGLLEPHPRFTVAWVHVGFIDHIADHGTLLTDLDGRFSWAGFFAAGGLLQRMAGTDTVLWLVRYAPIFYVGASVLLVALLARRTAATRTQTIVAAAVFCCLNWIGQDYFSPQATAFVLYLTIIAVVVYAFPADPSAIASGRLRRLLRPEPDEWQGVLGGGGSPSASMFALGVCYLLLVAMVISHQLTPVFFVSACSLLVICNVTRLRTMPIAAAVMFLAWLSFGASAYWIGHFDDLTGSIGHVGRLLDQNVGSRARSTNVDRQVVVTCRLLLALFAWGLAALSIVRDWLRHRTPVALLCLFMAPFPLLFMQPYGGEMALRVCFFSLPAASILIARLVVPTPRFAVVRLAAIAATAGLLVPAFVTARYGNEKFEMISDDDIAVVGQLYDQAPAGSLVFVATLQTLQYVDRVDEVRFRDLPSGTPARVTERLDRYPEATHVYLMFTETQAAYGVVAVGRADDWLDDLAAEFFSTGRYMVRAQAGHSVLLELERG